jgi:cupin superfamily acireductone dioxygenase involved in methionine salvage
MATLTKENMSSEITPTDSVCPVYLEPIDPTRIEADKAEAKAKLKAELENEINKVKKQYQFSWELFLVF